jgi:carbonyl reductase 1
MARAASPRLTVVSGANRGLGLEVCRQLAQAGRPVLLTARDADQAAAAARTLAGAGAGGGTVRAAQLDVTEPASVAALAEALRREGEPLAALVNNAGVALDGFDAEVVRSTLAVNVHGAARLTEALLPLLAPGGCVVMVSSGMGELAGLPPALRARFADAALARPALQALLDEFLAAVQAGGRGALAGGWPRSAYRVSKVALNALTRILAREQGPAGARVNAVCPGWVRTDMGGRAAPRGVAAGARSIVWAALLEADGPTGGFFRDGKPIPW